jgi:hypothetical protein
MIDLLILMLKPMLYFKYYIETRPKWWIAKASLLLVPTLLGVLADIIMNNTTVPLV